MNDSVLLNISDNIATISFNRPKQMNSYNTEMGVDLASVTEQVAADDGIRAVLIKGEGPLFMAGGDIHYFNENIDSLPAEITTMIRQLNSAILNIAQINKPIVACVHGSVAGVGISLMAAADLVIAERSTKFTLAYAKLGVTPDGGATYVLPRMLGNKRAAELFLLADVFDAKAACDYGLVNWVKPDDEIVGFTSKILHRLATGPSKAHGRLKQLLRQSMSNTLPEQLEAEAQSFAACVKEQDFGIGVKSFMEKQKPLFTGK